MFSTGVYHDDDFLIALLQAGGPRSKMMPTRVVLKVLREGVVKIEHSTLEFTDVDGRLVGEEVSAFGLKSNDSLKSPFVMRLSSNKARPDNAVFQNWTINNWSVSCPIEFEEQGSQTLNAVFLPLKVPIQADEHILLDIVNRTSEPMNIMEGVQTAVCVVDGESFASNIGGTWNGRYLLNPGNLTTRRFRLGDFPGTPNHGRHEISLHLLGMRTRTEIVSWVGKSWINPEQEVNS